MISSLPKVEENREAIVTAKLEKAFQRAKQKRQFKQEKLRVMFCKASEVKKRRLILEEERRQYVMASMENRLNSATMRVDNLVQKRQRHARYRYNKRRKQAVERRKKVDDYRENILNVRYKKALIRAQESLQFKQEKLRNMFSRVTIVKERRTILEQKLRKRVLTSRARRLNSALMRAEHVVKMKQFHSRYDKRRSKARDKRISLEFERRTHLLSTIDNRSERATRNLKLKLLNRQFKAREKVERAAYVSRRVKAVRLLQRVIRAKFRLEDGRDSKYQNIAASRLQKFWRTRVVLKRLINSDLSPSPINSLSLLLTSMGVKHGKKLPVKLSFEQMSSNMTQTTMLGCAQRFLGAFRPLLQCATYKKANKCILSNRIFLSSFLIIHYPNEVLGANLCDDKCSKLLAKWSECFVDQLKYFVEIFNGSGKRNIHSMHVAIDQLVASFIRYGTFFNHWKDADLNELISHMFTSAEQSWVAYLTSKEALAYGNEKTMTLSKKENDGVLFQITMKHDSSKNGAYKFIKRIRTSFEKLVGKEDALQMMKNAKQSAMQKIKAGKMMESLKTEIDEKFEDYRKSECLNDENTLKSEVLGAKSDQGDISSNLFSNADLVHKILLSGGCSTGDLFIDVPKKNEHIFETASNFMTYWHQRHANLSRDTNVSSLKRITSMTMELAYFDKIEHDLIANQDLQGVQDLLVNMIEKMRQLVPNRTDLHNFINNEDVMSCRSNTDALQLLSKMSCILSSDLESPYRSLSTIEWREHTEAYIDMEGAERKIIPFKFEALESFLVASISFHLQKIDLCYLDKINFELEKVVPLILQIGGEYERKQMQGQYGDFKSFSSMRALNATWGWLHRSKESFRVSPKFLMRVLKTDCFVDELLFVEDAITLPEVLSLDGKSINIIRKSAQTAVIGSTLFLHARNIAEISPGEQNSLTSHAQYHKKQLLFLLSREPSYESLSGVLIGFIEAIQRKVLVSVKKVSLLNLVEMVCVGNDPVFKILDSRMRQFFKFACGLSCYAEIVPPTMRAGVSMNANKASIINKSEQFIAKYENEADRLGFDVFSDDLAQAACEASNVINHSVRLYKDDIFLPLLGEMLSSNTEE